MNNKNPNIKPKNFEKRFTRIHARIAHTRRLIEMFRLVCTCSENTKVNHGNFLGYLQLVILTRAIIVELSNILNLSGNTLTITKIMSDCKDEAFKKEFTEGLNKYKDKFKALHKLRDQDVAHLDDKEFGGEEIDYNQILECLNEIEEKLCQLYAKVMGKPRYKFEISAEQDDILKELKCLLEKSS